MSAFVTGLQSFDDKNGDNEWIKLDSGSWEHSRWLDATLATKNFAGALFFRRGVDDPTRYNSAMELYAAIMKCTAPFAALIDPKGQFLELYDRRSMVNRRPSPRGSAAGSASERLLDYDRLKLNRSMISIYLFARMTRQSTANSSARQIPC
jgi:hypothetical protein